MTNGTGRHHGPAAKKTAKKSKPKDPRAAALKKKNLLPSGLAAGKKS